MVQVRVWDFCATLDRFASGYRVRLRFFGFSAKSGIMNRGLVIVFIDNDAKTTEIDFAVAKRGLSDGVEIGNLFGIISDAAVMDAMGANKAAGSLGKHARIF
jgi:hypothetical protein